MKYQSLHNHTIVSDGKLTYFETLNVCKKCGIGVVAFTDHDAVPDEKNIKKLKEIKHSVKWIMGCEISSGLPYELGGGAYSGLHIVGLFLNPFDKNLIEHCKLAQESRKERMAKIARNLRGLGFDITEEDCLRESKGEAVGRPHINAAIISKSNNLKIMEELKAKMEKDAESDPLLKKKYEEMLGRGEDGYAFYLFLTEDAYIKNVYVDYLYSIDLDKSVSLIRNAGGLAFIAHWTYGKKKVNKDVIEKIIKEKRIDGMEIIFGLGGVKEIEEERMKDMLIAEELTDKYCVLKSGGIDAHSEDDFLNFVKNERIAKKSLNLTENIIKKAHPDLTWSSFK